MNGNMREKFEAWAVKTYQRSLADIELMDASLWPHWQIAYCTGKAERLRELAVAQERIAELTPDAERYRWLFCNSNSWWHTWNPDAPPGLKQRVDNEIDAARKEEGK